MPRRRFVAAVAFAAAFLAAGCGSSSHTTAPAPAPVGTLADVRAMLLSTLVPGTQLPPNADSTASLLATMDVDGLCAASASFVVGASLAPAGTVTVRADASGGGVEEVALDRISTLYGGNPEYAYTTLVGHPLGIGLPFDATSYHRFTISGAATVPAFSDSIRATSLPALTAPAEGATVSRASALTVMWGDAAVDTTVYTTCVVLSLVDSAQVAAANLVRDGSGTAVVPLTRLGALPAGSAVLAVTRYRLVYHSVNGRKTGIASLGTRTRSITLQ